MIDVPVEVKDALRDGRLKKNYRIVVLNDDDTEDFTIDNNTLVSETVEIDERLCSGDVLRFGLCEGSSLEFQYFNHESILNRRLQVFVDVDYEIMRLVYETQLKFVRNQSVTITEDGNYRIYSESPDAFAFVYLTRGGEWEVLAPTSSEDGTELIIDLLVGDVLDIGWIGLSTPDAYLQKQVLKKQIEPYTIPMGFFTVQKCARQASTGIRKVTAYNKLQSDYLDAKANESVIAQFDNPQSTILMYDLERLMLSDYAIEQVEETEVQHTQWWWMIDADDASTTKFNRATTNSPINPKMFDWRFRPDLNRELQIYYQAYTSRYETDPAKYYRIDSVFDLNEFEWSMHDYIKDMIDGANLSGSSDYMSNLVKKCWGTISASTLQTWKRLFSIELVKNDDTVLSYSEVAQTYGLAVAGTMNDICKTTFTGVKEVRISIINGMGYWEGAPNSQSYTQQYVYDFFGEDFEYTYYTDAEWNEATATYPSFKYPNGDIIPSIVAEHETIKVVEIDGLNEVDVLPVRIDQLPEYTLRDISSAEYEIQCQFGQLSRITDLFGGVELNRSRLFPQETLYPDNALYPDGAQMSATKSTYSKLWADEDNVHKWRNLIITYKGLDDQNNEKDYIYEAEVNPDGTDDYICSDNWIFKNLVWTVIQIRQFANRMVSKMQDVTWFPYEMWCAGLPYLETGDEIEIPLGEQTYTSYVLQRQLKGIQNLQDTYINGTLDIF